MRFSTAASMALATALLSSGAASASTFNVIYSFCGVANCTNGAQPQGPLIRDSVGNIYGTVAGGGAAGGGAACSSFRSRTAAGPSG